MRPPSNGRARPTLAAGAAGFSGQGRSLVLLQSGWGKPIALIALEQLEGVRNLPFLKEGGTFFLGENRENPAAVSAGR